MTDAEKRGGNAEVAKGHIKRGFDRIRRVSDVSWILLGAGLLIGFLFGISAGLGEITERTKFIAGNVLSILALVVIVLQSLIYHRQRDIMERQLRLMRTQTSTLNLQAEISLEQRDLMEGEGRRQSAQATETADLMKGQLVAMQSQERAQYQSLEAMKEQAKTMDRSLVFGTRAYVGVHSIVFDPHKKRIFLEVENIGKVPAKNIEVTVELMILIPEKFMPQPAPDGTRQGWEYKKGVRPGAPGGEPLGEWELRIPWLHPYGRTKLFPGSLRIRIMIRLDEILYLSRWQYQTITAGHAKMFVRGVITYSDGFHSGKRTEFAFRYYLKDNVWIALPETGFEQFQTDPEKPDSDYSPN